VSNGRETDLNWEQVRDRIDRGETGDKRAAVDPAAAPLGADAEAGGSRTDSEHIARSAAAEKVGLEARAAAQGRSFARPRRALTGLALAAVAVVGAVAAMALVLVL